ncbi:MAG: transcription antitermination factor NusB, partial [Pseudomonadota bacterium]
MNTPAKSQARSTARLAAVQALYQLQMEGTALNKLLDEFHQHRLGREVEDEDHEGEVYVDAETDFFDDIVRGVDARREEIDATLLA